ncbi:pentapeptide repeat-containing protein [Nonomuraea indica]|uniref:Pentapeptide repeat-containing protein n=1 Tax=Nonomuraea indica TaxID=1581193 RepID=A0ABW8ABP3_9ACTN
MFPLAVAGQGRDGRQVRRDRAPRRARLRRARLRRARLRRARLRRARLRRARLRARVRGGDRLEEEAEGDERQQ